MYLARIQLRGFRNHAETCVEFGGGTNVLAGDNGQGKTNIIEGISYLCLTKSFYASNDGIVVGFGKGAFEIEGTFVSDARTEADVRVVYIAESKEKVYALNRKRIEPFSSVVGRFPVVILSPEHAPITLGPPAERRRFMDLLLSQASAAYFEDILEYRRILRQRNRILTDAKGARTDVDHLLQPWDDQLAAVGARLMQRRRMFVEDFRSLMVSSYHAITDDAEEPGIAYVPAVEAATGGGLEEISAALRRDLLVRRGEEIRLGTTLAGPHRDELNCTINGHDLRRFASQGQHKTFLIALKVGEFLYLKQARRETPVVLLDDVFSELDDRRTKRVLGLVGELGQTVVTSTAPGIFEDAIPFGDRNRRFVVSSGAVALPAGMPSA